MLARMSRVSRMRLSLLTRLEIEDGSLLLLVGRRLLSSIWPVRFLTVPVG